MTESRGNRTTYLGVGIAFLPLAIALWITLDNWAIALPFAVLAITFVILGAKSGPESTSDENDGA